MADFGEKLLKQFVMQGDERAFREFVERYATMVFQVASRQTGSRQLAEEVSQNVFCAVLKKSSRLLKHPERIPGWLHRAALFESKMTMRKERSFQRRKQLQHPDEIEATAESSEQAWMTAVPHLDPALNSLSESDRMVVLQHYFEGKSFPQIGHQLSRPAATVQKQCRRAVAKLERILRGKGLVISATALASGLGAQSGKAASVSLVAQISKQALSGGASYSVTPLTLYMTSKSKIVVGAALAALAIPLGVQQAAIHRSTAENVQLLEKVAAGQVRASTRSTPQENRRAFVISPHREITLEVLRQAYEESRRGGTFRKNEFEELLVSLSAEELGKLLTEELQTEAAQGTRRVMASEMFVRLAQFDEEKAIRVAWEANPEAVLLGTLEIGEAVHLWATKNPEQAISWLEDVQGKVAEFSESTRYFESGHQGLGAVFAAALNAFILSDSPHTREVLFMIPALKPQSLIRSAMKVNYERSGGGVAEQAERLLAFMPWMREFSPDEQTALFEDLMSGGEYLAETGFYKTLLESSKITSNERVSMVQLRTNALLEQHFNSSAGPSWEKAEEEAKTWLLSYAVEDGEAWFQEIRDRFLASKRSENERYFQHLKNRKEVPPENLSGELFARKLAMFPEFKEQAREQASRIQDPEKRREILKTLE